MLKGMKKTITILLVISLLYANIAGTAFSIVSYALDNKVDIVIGEEYEEKENTLEIQTTEFCKNDMGEEETEYQEKMNLKLDMDEEFYEVKINDIETVISTEKMKVEENENEEVDIEEESEKITEIFYKSTQINKAELYEIIGENGLLEIHYIEKIQENENIEENIENIFEQSNLVKLPEELSNDIITLPEEDVIVLPKVEEENIIVLPEEEEGEAEIIETENDEEENKGIIIAEDGVIQINAQTEADEEGFITIVYPEKSVISLNISIKAENMKNASLTIENTKKIEKVQDIESVKTLETIKELIVNGEEEILNKQESSNMPINYTQTVAELGIDKNQISTSIENKVNFTITMLTNGVKFDLYKNPQFVIEIPKEIEDVKVENIIDLNTDEFEVESSEIVSLENGNKGIAIKLNGEQSQKTNSKEENIQIVVETVLKTNKLLPTLEKTINLHYKNENVKTYDAEGTQTTGISTIVVNLIANKEIIVETTATIGDKTVTSFKDEFATINVEPKTYNTAEIKGIVVNNIGEDIENAKILGNVKNIGPITGVENVYYTENENATVDLNDVNNGWTKEYTQNVTKYLIYVENFMQGQAINFGYILYMPEMIEDDIKYNLVYDVYNGNNEIMKTSKITINQEAEHLDYYEDENIKASITIEDKKVIEIGDRIIYKIRVENVSGRDINNFKAKFNQLAGTENFLKRVDCNQEGLYIRLNNDKFMFDKLVFEKDEIIEFMMIDDFKEFETTNQSIKVNIEYEDTNVKISEKIKITEPSTIETAITSDKLNQTLEKNEYIEYRVLLRNNGNSHAIITVTLPEMPGMIVQKIETVNTATGGLVGIGNGELEGLLEGVSINPGEVIQLTILCCAKELEKDTTNTMYVTVTANNIYTVETDKLINHINKAEVIEEDKSDNEEQLKEEKPKENETNNISGTAWLDKNQNGKLDNNENVLKGVQAVLINTKTSEEVEKTVTNNKGEYEFKNLEKGAYVVSFNYNTQEFQVTDYKKEEVEENLNSSVINTTQNSKTVAKTEVLKLEEGNNETVNIGLILNKKFDMSINKGITKVIVTNEKGTENYEFGNTNMAKVEIDGKYLKGSLILVEYQIAVTNSGEVAGYARMISDKIPEGMKFSSELNTNWYEGDDGILYCEALSNKELLPGETTMVKLILTKEMTEDKVISPVNTAAIEESFNEYLIEDKKQENNSAEATIIISISTGKVQSYIWLVLVVMAIVTMGTFGVIKVTKKETMKERSK